MRRSASASLPRTVRPGVDGGPAARVDEPGVGDGGPGGALALVRDGVGQADQGDLRQGARAEVGLHLDQRATLARLRRSGWAADFRERGGFREERSARHDEEQAESV